MVKKNKRQQNIKTKLIAAICMLLVSSIMMVSSTYAWFTLSTAPEVTGITTSVGANGNLEMALVKDLTMQDFGITSGAGDSIKDWTIKNLTWGNLVNLENSDFYGLDKITLYPAQLNPATEDGNKNPLTLDEASLLFTPAYGADGRVSELLKNTVTSIYDSANKSFPQTAGFGVRAVGVASGMTDRQLAYRSARSAANTAMAQAKTFASQSLNTNGAALANIALAHGVDANATHTGTDVQNLLKIVNDLLGYEDGSKHVTGVLEYIEAGYLNYIVAFAASDQAAKAGLTDENFKLLQAAVTGADDLYAAVDLFGEGNAYGVTLPASITAPVALLEDTRTKVETAKTELSAITKTEGITWSELSTPLNRLADTSAMTINGHAASSVKDNMSAIINSVASQGLTVAIASGGGVYADVADHCGNFTASIVIQEVTYGNLTLENMNARMETKSNQADPYLSVLGKAVEGMKAPESAGGQIMPISDMYGYIVDLAFRTNAAESNLLLQTTAVDRIYKEDGGEDTMGAGSTMTFTATTPDFTAEKIKGLMSAIRIVFFNPDDHSVYATAKLDITNATVGAGGNSVTASIYLYTVAAGETTYTEATDGTYVKVGEEYKLYDSLTDDEKTTYEDATRYSEVAGTATETWLKDGDAVITALTQGQAHAVSALVYLDGATITNKDVAATASTSATGTMNLQFASSANLVPMEYTDLMEQGNETTTTP